MRRRALLASLAASSAALAGCQTQSNGTDGTSTSTTTDDSNSDDTTRPPDDESPEGQASVVTLETQPRRLSIFPTTYHSQDGGDVDVKFTRTATADHPAVLRIELQNDNKFSNVFRLPDHPPLDRTPSFYPEAQPWPGMDEPPEDARRLYLAPLEDQSLPKAAPDVERDPSGVWRLAERASGPWLPATERLESGESMTVDFAVVSAAEGRGPFTELRRRKRLPQDQPLTLAAWNPDHPGPVTDSRFAGRTFPPLPDHSGDSDEPTAWFHAAGGDETVYLRPQTEHSDLPRTFRFALVNHDTEPAMGNPYYWSLYKLAEGQWQRLTPQVFPAVVGALAPGGVKRYTLRAANGEALPCSDGQTVGFLGGGTYAFEAGMSASDRTQAAVFEVDAPPVEVTPMDGLEVRSEDGVVVVTGPRWADADNRALVTVARAETADPLLLPERVAREPAFRNTLPFFEEGVSQVEYRTTLWRAGPARELDRARYRGQAFAFGVEDRAE